MAHTKSALKQIRKSRKVQLSNKSVRSMTKTKITSAEKQVASGETGLAKEAVTAAIKSLDRAAERGVIHPNNAARRKSRLVKKLNQAQASASTKTESKEKAK